MKMNGLNMTYITNEDKRNERCELAAGWSWIFHASTHGTDLMLTLVAKSKSNGLSGTAGDVAVAGPQCNVVFANGGDVHDAVL